MKNCFLILVFVFFGESTLAADQFRGLCKTEREVMDCALAEECAVNKAQFDCYQDGFEQCIASKSEILGKAKNWCVAEAIIDNKEVKNPSRYLRRDKIIIIDPYIYGSKVTFNENSDQTCEKAKLTAKRRALSKCRSARWKKCWIVHSGIVGMTFDSCTARAIAQPTLLERYP